MGNRYAMPSVAVASILAEQEAWEADKAMGSSAGNLHKSLIAVVKNVNSNILL